MSKKEELLLKDSAVPVWEVGFAKPIEDEISKTPAWAMKDSLMNSKPLHLGKKRSWTREELYER